MTGKLDGTLDGQPVTVDAHERDVLITFASLGSLWQLRGLKSPVVTTLLRILRKTGVKLRVRITSLITLEVTPKPSGVVRFFAPGFVLPDPA